MASNTETVANDANENIENVSPNKKNTDLKRTHLNYLLENLKVQFIKEMFCDVVLVAVDKTK